MPGTVLGAQYTQVIKAVPAVKALVTCLPNRARVPVGFQPERTVAFISARQDKSFVCKESCLGNIKDGKPTGFDA